MDERELESDLTATEAMRILRLKDRDALYAEVAKGRRAAVDTYRSGGNPALVAQRRPQLPDWAKGVRPLVGR